MCFKILVGYTRLTVALFQKIFDLLVKCSLISFDRQSLQMIDLNMRCLKIINLMHEKYEVYQLSDHTTQSFLYTLLHQQKHCRLWFGTKHPELDVESQFCRNSLCISDKVVNLSIFHFLIMLDFSGGCEDEMT